MAYRGSVQLTGALAHKPVGTSCPCYPAGTVFEFRFSVYIHKHLALGASQGHIPACRIALLVKSSTRFHNSCIARTHFVKQQRGVGTWFSTLLSLKGGIMKMLANKMAFAVALVFGTAAAPAMAENFYGALDLGQTKAADACAGATSACEDTATLVRVAGGYQFDPMWSAEISYGASKKGSLGVILPGVTGAWEVDVLQISGIGTFPVGGGFSLTGKVGIARSDLTLTSAGLAAVSISSSTTNVAFGIGAQYDFTGSIAARAQYETFGTIGDVNTTGESKVSLLSAGVIFKF